jgi:hypothetical protein
VLTQPAVGPAAGWGSPQAYTLAPDLSVLTNVRPNRTTTSRGADGRRLGELLLNQRMTDAPPSAAVPSEARRTAGSWGAVVGYFVVFFAAMTLAGFLFLLGGVAIVLIPGSLPVWADVAYVAFGIVGSVAIALIAANGAFRVASRRRHGGTPATENQARPRTPAALAWVAGVAGTVLASVLSAVLGAVVLGWLGR